MPESILTALIQTVSSLLPNDPIIEHPKSVSALVANTVDLLQGPGLAAGLSCIPKTIYHRWTGESKCPQWSLPEELSVNLVRALATGDGSNDLTRMMIGVAAGFSAYSCGEAVESVKPLEFPVKGWWIGPPLQDRTNDLVVLYIHGGAMVSGNPLQSSPGLATIVKNLRGHNVNARIFTTWYPKAPDGPWPAGLEWCTRTYRWLVDVEQYQNVIILGDSAGGNLTLTTGLLLRDRHPTTLQPLGLCALSPWVDIESKTYAVRNIGVDYLTESPGGGSFQRYYTGQKYQFYKKRRASLATAPNVFSMSKQQLAELSEMQIAEVKRLEQEDAQRPIHQHAAFPSTFVPDDPEELEKRHHELARHPLVSPLYASFHAMPHLLVCAGGKELLFDDVLRMYRIAKRHAELSGGGEVEWLADPLGIHVYPLLQDLQGDRSLRALDHISNWMARIIKERWEIQKALEEEVQEMKLKLSELQRRSSVSMPRPGPAKPPSKSHRSTVRPWVIEQQQAKLEKTIVEKEQKKSMRWQSLGKLDLPPQDLPEVDLEALEEVDENRWEDEVCIWYRGYKLTSQTFHPEEVVFFLDSSLLPST